MATPGPNTLLVANMAAGGARRAALWAAIGTGAGALLWVAATLGGASALFVAFPRLADALRWLGGGYLVFLGGQALWSAWRERGPGMPAAAFAPNSVGAAFRRRLMTNLGNPKSLAYYLSLLVASAASAAPGWLRITGAAGMAAISRAPIQRLYRRVQTVVAGGTGVLMVGFGLALVFAL